MNKSKITKEILPINDAIDHPLVVGDFVTAVWDSGNLCLFKVMGFAKRKRWLLSGETYIKLDRVKNTAAWTRYENVKRKPVLKRGEQVTWVDPNYVLIHFLSQ